MSLTPGSKNTMEYSTPTPHKKQDVTTKNIKQLTVLFWVDLFHGFSNFLSSAKNHYRFFYQAKKITTTKFLKKSLLTKTIVLCY